MPYKECFAWAIVPLFENHNTASGGGATSPGSSLAPTISGSGFQDGIGEPVAKAGYDGKLPQGSTGSSVILEISNLNKVKESYTEDTLQVTFLLIFCSAAFVANHFFNQIL